MRNINDFYDELQKTVAETHQNLKEFYSEYRAELTEEFDPFDDEEKVWYN